MALRAEWEVARRLRTILHNCSKQTTNPDDFQSRLRKAKSLHSLVELLAETSQATEQLIRSIRKIATIRNKLVHQTDFIRIRNLMAFDATFIHVTQLLDELLTNQTNKHHFENSVPFPHPASNSTFFLASTIELSKRLESLMRDKLSASGKGLLEKFRSVAHILPRSTQRCIATFARERNLLLHYPDRFNSVSYRSLADAQKACELLTDNEEPQLRQLAEDEVHAEAKRQAELELAERKNRESRQREYETQEMNRRAAIDAAAEEAKRLKILASCSAGKVAATCILRNFLYFVFFCPWALLITFVKVAQFFESIALGFASLLVWTLPGLFVFFSFDWNRGTTFRDVALLEKQAKRCIWYSTALYVFIGLVSYAAMFSWFGFGILR